MIIAESKFDTDYMSYIIIESSFAGTGGGGGGTWGSITGTLSNQTDLQIALDAKIPYSGATGNVTLGEYGLTTGYEQFDLTPTQTGGVGRLIWNDTDGTLDLGLKGGSVTLQIGEEQYVRVVNKTGSTLNQSAYQVVRVSTAQGQRLGVALAQGNNDANSAETIGIVAETITNNSEGFITTSGIISDINTTGSLQGETWADGNLLYLSATTAGQITNVKPTAPNHTVYLGYVVYAHATQGKIFVKIDNGYELDELHDVYITSVANNQALVWNSTNLRWENKTLNTSFITENTNLYYTDARARASISESITGIDYNNSTGVFSMTAGYALPTSASQTNWDAAYTFTNAFPSQTGNNGKYLTTNGTALSWGTISQALSGLSDVTLTTPLNSQVLTYNGTKWVNQAAPVNVASNLFNYYSFI